jgi:hypothetical protein
MVTEANEQAAFVRWFRKTYPKDAYAMRASMAGLPRHGKRGAILWNLMTAQGLNKGEPDIAILLPRGGYGALLVEHKAEGQTHKLTAEQEQHIKYHNDSGNLAVQTRGLEQLMQVVRDYMEMEQ